MSRFVVTGGAGFLASHLVDRLLSEGHHVIALDNLSTGDTRNLSHLKNESRFEFHEADVTQEWPQLGTVDSVMHLASPASPIDFVPMAVPILKVGSFGTYRGLEFAKKCGAWFFLASTSEVYGDPLEHPQKESYLGNVNPVGIRGVYDEAKRFAESLTMAYHRKKEVKTSIVRIFNTYGPRMRKEDGRVIPNFIMQALTGTPITLHGEGVQTRSFCYVDDLIEGFIRFSKIQPEGPINLGNNRERTVRELAETIIQLTDSASELVHKPMPEDDPQRRCPDISRARSILDWEPKVDLKKGLQSTIDYFRSIS